MRRMSTPPFPTPAPFIEMVRYALSKMDPEGILLAIHCCAVMPPEDVKMLQPVERTFGVLREMLHKGKLSCLFVESIVMPFMAAGYITNPVMVFDPYDVLAAINTEAMDRMIKSVRPNSSEFAPIAVASSLRAAFESGRIYSGKDGSWLRDTDLATDILHVLSARDDIPVEHLVPTTRGLIHVTRQVLAWRLSCSVGLEVGVDLTGVARPPEEQRRPLVPLSAMKEDEKSFASAAAATSQEGNVVAVAPPSHGPSTA